MNVSLRPSGVKFYGVFHTPPYAYGSDSSRMYSEPNFNLYFKPQIDAIKAIGANTLVYFGDVNWRHAGPGEAPSMTLANYVGERRRIVEYLASKDMYAISYAALTFGQWGGITKNAEAVEIMAADAAMMGQYDNVPCYVTTDEPWANSISDVNDGGVPSPGVTLLTTTEVLNNLSAQYNAVKGVVPADLPVCCAPNPCGNSAIPVFKYSGNWKSRADQVAPYCDFFAFHPFAAQVVADHAAIRAAYPGKELIFPSSVASQNGDGDVATRTASIMTLANDATARGMAYFLFQDFSAATWGLFNSDLTPRTTKTAQFTAGVLTTYPHRQLRGYSSKPRNTQSLAWDYR